VSPACARAAIPLSTLRLWLLSLGGWLGVEVQFGTNSAISSLDPQRDLTLGTI
jgi:hypothetical protein